MFGFQKSQQYLAVLVVVSSIQVSALSMAQTVNSGHIDMRTQQTVDTGHIDMRTGTLRGSTLRVYNERRDPVTNIAVPAAIGGVVGGATGAVFGDVSILEGAAVGAGTGAAFGAAEHYLPDRSIEQRTAKGAALGLGAGILAGEILTGGLIGAGAGAVYHVIKRQGWFGRETCYNLQGNPVVCP